MQSSEAVSLLAPDDDAGFAQEKNVDELITMANNVAKQ